MRLPEDFSKAEREAKALETELFGSAPLEEIQKNESPPRPEKIYVPILEILGILVLVAGCLFFISSSHGREARIIIGQLTQTLTIITIVFAIIAPFILFRILLIVIKTLVKVLVFLYEKLVEYLMERQRAQKFASNEPWSLNRLICRLTGGARSGNRYHH